MVTFNRVCNGHFDVLKDGVKTDYYIVNGSLGVSGRGRNLYGIGRESEIGQGTIKWLGPLATCKRVVTNWLSK